MSQTIAFNPRQTTGSLALNDCPFRVQVLNSKQDQREVYRLRYSAYRNDGHIPHDPSGMFCDPSDYLTATAQIAAYDGPSCIGALRVSFSSANGLFGSLPCMPYYPEAKDLAEQPGRRLVEISRLAVDPGISNTSYRTTLYATMVRAGLIAADAGYTTDILVATKPSSVKFYEYMLGATRLGKPAKYPPGDIEITLLRLPLSEAKMRQRRQNQFFRISTDEIASMREALEPVLRFSAINMQNQTAS